MAQYLIAGARHERGVIVVVRAGWVDAPANSMRDIGLYSRADVLNWIRQGHAVNTSKTYSDQGTERWPTHAKVMETNDRRFITTEPNGCTWDNLGELPTC